MDQYVVQKSYPPNAPSANGELRPTGIPLPHARVGTQGEWSTGLCDCFSDVSNCCVTCWCPCITFGRIAEITDRGSTCKRRHVFHFMRGSYESCGASGALYTLVALVTGCACIYSCFYRSRMRKQYMLSEDPCADCLVHFCCESCALCQEYRELKNRGFDMSLGWHGNVDKLNPATTMAPGVEGGMSR